jgi:hypothetical protein
LQEQEQIVALTTELGKIKDTSLQLTCSLSKKQAKSSNKPKSDKKKKTKARVRARRDPSMFTLANGPGRTMLLHKGILR